MNEKSVRVNTVCVCVYGRQVGEDRGTGRNSEFEIEGGRGQKWEKAKALVSVRSSAANGD